MPLTMRIIITGITATIVITIITTIDAKNLEQDGAACESVQPFSFG